jgi:hypothetical protein
MTRFSERISVRLGSHDAVESMIRPGTTTSGLRERKYHPIQAFCYKIDITVFRYGTAAMPDTHDMNYQRKAAEPPGFRE